MQEHKSFLIKDLLGDVLVGIQERMEKGKRLFYLNVWVCLCKYFKLVGYYCFNEFCLYVDLPHYLKKIFGLGLRV